MRIRYQVCVVFLSTIVRWIASQPECLSILTLIPPFPPSLPHIQLNCHPDVLNPSVFTPIPEPQTSPPTIPVSTFLLVLVIVPPCTPPVCSWRRILILVFPPLLSPRLMYPALVPFLSLTYCNATTFYPTLSLLWCILTLENETFK